MTDSPKQRKIEIHLTCKDMGKDKAKLEEDQEDQED